MSIDTGRKRIDEERRSRRRVVGLTPDAKPRQDGELLAPSPSQESGDQSKPRERKESSGPKEDAKEGARGISLLPTWLRRLRYYGLALLLVGVAALLRWALSDVLRPTPFLLFYLAWVGAAAFGGLGPGLLATLASWWCIELLFDPTASHIGFHDVASVARLLVFLAGGLAVSVVGEKMRRTRIHERRQGRELAEANTALRVSEEKYRFLVENSKDITWTIDLQGTWTFISGNVEKVTGYRADQVIGKTIWDFLAPECHDLVKDRLRRRMRGEDLPPYEVLVVGKDGRHTPFELLTASIVDADGNIVGVQGVSRDITERKRAEEALQFTQFAVDHTADAAFWMTEDAKLFYVNEAACRALGYSREELLHMTVFDIDPAFTENLWRESWRRLRAEKNIVLETVHRARDGRIYPVEIRANYLEFGGRAYDCAFARDITERKRTQEAVVESRKRYRGLVEKINDWVWEVDADGVYTYSSPRSLELLGYAPEEVMGKTPFDFMPPAEAQRVWDAFQPIWLERKPLELLDNTLVRKDGRLVTVETSGMPMFAEDGAFLGYTGIDRDVTARKRAEEALRASQAMLRSVMDNVPQGIFWKDRHSTYLGCNHVFAQAAGLESAGDIVGKTDYDLPWSSEQTASFREYDRRIMENDAPEYHIIEQQREVNGKLAWLETNKVPLHDAQGHVIGILGTYEDITERKQAEEALRESEEKFRLLAETSPAAILIYQDGKYVYANPAAEVITGYSCAELLPQAIEDIIHPDYRQQVRQMVSRRAQGEGPPVHYELKTLTKDGRERWMDSATASIMYGNKPAGLVVAFDITERKRAEESLRQAKAFTDKLLNAPLDTVFLFEPVTGKPVRWNKRFVEVSGYDDEEIAGMRAPDDFYDEHDLKKAKEWIGRILADGQGVVALSLITKQGVHIPFEYVVTVVEAEDGKTLLLSIGRDITERKRAEEALREWNATLESKVARRTEQLEHRARQLQKLTLELTEAEERERKRLAEILHDDLQQVLAAAKFQLGLLDGRVRNDAESQEIAEQARDLLVDAIAKSRSLSHELSAPALSQSDLGEAFEWLAEQMQKKHGFTVHLDMDERIELASEPLRVLLYKAAQELLFNAIKHAGVREAKLRLRRQRGRLRLSVSDKGRGFDPAEPGSDLGFGLLSIRERVGYLGGRMKIRSAPGKGSIFLITVPASDVREGE